MLIQTSAALLAVNVEIASSPIPKRRFTTISFESIRSLFRGEQSGKS
jgi:hypothetical protein